MIAVEFKRGRHRNVKARKSKALQWSWYSDMEIVTEWETKIWSRRRAVEELGGGMETQLQHAGLRWDTGHPLCHIYVSLNSLYLQEKEILSDQLQHIFSHFIYMCVFWILCDIKGTFCELISFCLKPSITRPCFAVLHENTGKAVWGYPVDTAISGAAGLSFAWNPDAAGELREQTQSWLMLSQPAGLTEEHSLVWLEWETGGVCFTL